jgi:hypothetical protein
MAKLYDWGDGKGRVHTISKAQHEKNVAEQQANTRVLKPPPGTYDVGLDQQERASQRGLTDLIQDVAQGKERLSTDLGLGLTDIGTQRNRLGEDYTTGVGQVEQSYGRSLADLLTARKQGGEDYNANVGNLQRSYDRLGVQQGETARKAGALSTGGAFAQADRKRAENQALDRAPIDTAFQRFNEASALSESRLGEDKQTSLNDLLRGFTRGNQDLDTGTGQLGLNYNRSFEDLTGQQTRAEREAAAFGLDTAEARQAQYGGPVVTVVPSTPKVPVKKPKKPKVVTYRNSYPRTA